MFKLLQNCFSQTCKEICSTYIILKIFLGKIAVPAKLPAEDFHTIYSLSLITGTVILIYLELKLPSMFEK